MEPQEGQVIAVWFSCGAASAVAAKRVLQKYGNLCEIRIINNPVVEEHPDNLRFLKDCEDWLGVKIESCINPKYAHCSAEQVWEKEQYMSGLGGARCTKELKKAARQFWESTNHHDWIVLGFTTEERRRHENFVLSERSNVLPVLIEEGLTKEDCFRIIQEAGLEPPEIYKLGYPNANCIGCVKAGSPTYWNHVRKMHPDVFKRRAEQSRRIGCKLAMIKGSRIYLDELDPATKGRPMKTLKMPDCGIFCEEKILK